jgi:hypothetical protein
LNSKIFEIPKGKCNPGRMFHLTIDLPNNHPDKADSKVLIVCDLVNKNKAAYCWVLNF